MKFASPREKRCFASSTATDTAIAGGSASSAKLSVSAHRNSHFSSGRIFLQCVATSQSKPARWRFMVNQRFFTSGVAPGLILFSILSEGGGPLVRFFSLTAFLVPLFAAYRLAKFNLDTRQSHSFLGLPTPANALIWVGLALYLVPLGSCDCELCIAEGEFERNPLLTNNVFLTALIIISLVTDILMVSELPMFSLKVNFKDMSWKTNSIQYIFLIVCAIIIVATRQWYAVSLIIIWYILLSLITCKRDNAH